MSDLQSQAVISHEYIAPAVQVNGDVTYNGRQFSEFVPLRTAAYVEQNDTVPSAFIRLSLVPCRASFPYCWELKSCWEMRFPHFWELQRGAIWPSRTGLLSNWSAYPSFIGYSSVIPRCWCCILLQHIGEITVRETFDFAARCQGAGSKKGFCHLYHSQRQL